MKMRSHSPFTLTFEIKNRVNKQGHLPALAGSEALQAKVPLALNIGRLTNRKRAHHLTYIYLNLSRIPSRSIKSHCSRISRNCVVLALDILARLIARLSYQRPAGIPKLSKRASGLDLKGKGCEVCIQYLAGYACKS